MDTLEYENAVAGNAPRSIENIKKIVFVIALITVSNAVFANFSFVCNNDSLLTKKSVQTEQDTAKSKNASLEQLSKDIHGILSATSPMLARHSMKKDTTTYDESIEELTYEYQKAKRAYDRGDDEMAEYWFMKAALKGNSAAMYELGCLNYQDGAVSIKWMTRAAEWGNVEAMSYLGWLYFMKVPNFKESLKWYTQAAEKGDVDAMLNLGHLYSTDIPPLRKGRNYKKARQWYEKAAENDNKDAMYQLGRLYYHGYGVKKDKQKAVDWFTKCGTNSALEFIEKIIIKRK